MGTRYSLAVCTGGDDAESNERTVFDPEMRERRNKRSESEHAFDPRTTIKLIYHI
ncbi:MAG: hypothetical protein U5N56_03945 [Candidatus Marinimicrobia bacterium]|nr:hypothetical protein [Candidatus Neomarinimicrobiota bacterium]